MASDITSDDYWKDKLTDDQYKILREKGTEEPFTGKMLNEKRSGTFTCAACGNSLFESETKYDSECGWPSFSKAKGIETQDDNSLSAQRTEVICDKCRSHLGHVFDDGPGPDGKRFCINSLALDFKTKQD